MSNNSNNNTNSNNTLTRADGSVNCDNPRVTAALVDGIGMILSRVFQDLKANPALLDSIPADMQADLDSVLHTLRLIRNNIGVDTDWYNENQSNMIPEIMGESEAKREKFRANIVSAMIAAGFPADMLPKELQPKVDPSAAADAILSQLRADGIIG